MNNGYLKYNIIKFVILFLVTMLFHQIAPFLKIGGIVPNISFILVLSATMAESDTGIFFPLVFGIIYDYMNGIVLGMYIIIYVLVTFVAGEIYHKNFENVTFVEVLFVIAGSFFYSFLGAFFISFLEEGFWNLFIKIALPEFLYNSVLGIIVFLIYKKVVSAPSGGRRRRSRRNSAWRV